MDGPVDERELARAAQRGSAAGFEQLARLYQVPLMRFLLRRLPRRCDAEDVLQETFVRAFRKIGRYDERWPFRTWIFTIACRLANRHRGRRCELLVEGEVATDGTAPAARLEARERGESVWQIAREALGEVEFTALWLHYGEGMPLEQVGQVLGKSWGSVKTMLHRARKRLEPRVRHLAPGATGPGPQIGATNYDTP